jgi:hypothetical protein
MNDHDIDKIIREIVFEMEDEGGKKTYTSSVSTGNSGISFGRMQHDVGKEGGRNKLIKVLDAAGIGKDKKAELVGALGKDGGRSMTAGQRDIINGALASDGGKKVVDQLDKDEVKVVTSRLKKVIEAAKRNPNGAGSFDPNHPDFRKTIGAASAWINRTGDPKKLAPYVEGKPVTLNNGQSTVKLPSGKAPSLGGITKEYLPATKQFQPKDKGGNGEEIGTWIGRLNNAAGGNQGAAPKPAQPEAAKPQPKAPDAPAAPTAPAAPEQDIDPAVPPSSAAPKEPEAPEDDPGLGDEIDGLGGASRNGAAGDKPESKTNQKADAEIIKEQFVNALVAKGSEADEILLKRPADWTEDEMAAIMGSEVYGRPDDQIGGFSNDQVTRWHEAAYGADGKPPKVQPKSGPKLDKPLDAIADGLSKRSGERDRRHAVMDLQSSINALPSERRGGAADGADFVPTLIVDGELGPKTHFAVKKAIAGFGAPKVLAAVQRQFGWAA